MSKIFIDTDLKSYMRKAVPSPDGTLIATVTNAVNQWVENETNRCWGETRTVTERYDWAPRIWLRHQDVQVIVSLKLGYPGSQQSTLTAQSYFVNSFGRLTLYLQQPRMFNPSPVNNDLVEIQYTYGHEAIPDDLQLAALGIAANMYNWAASGNKDVVASSVGSYKVQYIGSVRGMGTGKPNPANNTAEAGYAIVKSYKTRKQ